MKRQKERKRNTDASKILNAQNVLLQELQNLKSVKKNSKRRPKRLRKRLRKLPIESKEELKSLKTDLLNNRKRIKKQRLKSRKLRKLLNKIRFLLLLLNQPQVLFMVLPEKPPNI